MKYFFKVLFFTYLLIFFPTLSFAGEDSTWRDQKFSYIVEAGKLVATAGIWKVEQIVDFNSDTISSTYNQTHIGGTGKDSFQWYWTAPLTKIKEIKIVNNEDTPGLAPWYVIIKYDCICVTLEESRVFHNNGTEIPAPLEHKTYFVLEFADYNIAQRAISEIKSVTKM